MKIINIDKDYKLDKLILDSNSLVKIDFENTNKKIEFIIKDNINVKFFCKFKNTSNKVSYQIGANTEVIVDKFAINTSDNIEVNLNSENSSIIYNLGVINSKDNSYKQVINHNTKNTTSRVVNHALSISDDTFKFIIDGVIKKDSSNSSLMQDNKIINLKSGKSFIEPNLIIDNDEVEANHSAYIGSFDEEIKFYLMSRGIKEKETYDLLIKSFLLNEMSLNAYDRNEILMMIEEVHIE